MRNCIAPLDWRFMRKIQIDISKPRRVPKMDLELLRIIVQRLKLSLLRPQNLVFRACCTSVTCNEHVTCDEHIL